MPVCIFNTLARSSCQPLLSQLLQQTAPLYTGPCCLSWCPCCRLQPLCPPTPALTHSCPSPLPLSIAILLPSRHPLRRRRRCPLQLCHQLVAAITVSHCNCAAGHPRPLPHTRRHRCTLSHARMLPLLHAVACTPHPLPAAARTLAACCPLQSCPWLPLPAAAHTHAACCRTHAATAAYCYTHAASTTAPVTTATSAAAGATCIDS
jgi:hypothetical protein